MPKLAVEPTANSPQRSVCSEGIMHRQKLRAHSITIVEVLTRSLKVKNRL